MNSIALLVGFNYKGTNKYIPGVNMDIVRMIHHCVRHLNIDTVFIWTDIKTVLTNIKIIMEYKHKLRVYAYKNYELMMEQIKPVKNCRHLLMYFSGHKGRKGDSKYPDRAVFPDGSIRLDGWINSSLHKIKPLQSMVILDCCYSDSYINISYSGPVIVFTSCHPDQKSIIGRDGSIFTRLWIRMCRSGFIGTFEQFQSHIYKHMLEYFTSGLSKTINIKWRKRPCPRPHIHCYNERKDSIIWPWILGMFV